MLGHGLAQGGHHIAPQHNVVPDCGVPQVQIAVLQPGGLVGVPAPVDLKGQLVVAAAAQHLDLAGDDLHIAGGHLGVLAVPLPDGAGDLNGGLLIEALDNGHHVLGLDDHLGGAVKIPDDDEGEVLAHLPDVFHPSGNGDGLARVAQPQLAAGVGSGLKHIEIPHFC